jgi:hypothetical protein
LKRRRDGSLPAAEVERFDAAVKEEDFYAHEAFCALEEKEEWLYDRETA